MKRIDEKVKDLIDVRPYEVIQDLLADPAQTLSIYHFTDITADLMAQWLDKVVAVDIGNGASNALAGYRGVGKSHFLATLGAIISQPELRSRISDSHVEASAQRLKRKRHPVAYVRRGIFDSFTDELRAAIAKVLEIDVTPIETLAELLKLAADRAGDIPFVLIIDTAFERASRVSRDDGQILSEIADIAKDLNMFVGVALDDDIAGADGANAAITRTYAIDYLDQEHLYKIVNNYIFPKHRQTLPLLHEIYKEFRKMLPSFRWSEQRFVSLYPLHPVTLEIAPYVRLYAQDFALLRFTSSAGNRILGRPANSLIALDEVFDSVEVSLRTVADLSDAFAAYDKLNTEVVANIPIMQRMQAKLILKGLLLLSLDGYGTTVGEISAAMLIFNEDDPNKATEEVKQLLETFVTAYPENLERLEEDGRETRYSLKISNKDDLNNALADAIKTVSKGVIPKILRRVGRERFPEWILPADGEAQRGDITDCHAVWRGGLRRGKVIWDLESNYTSQNLTAESADVYDWEVIINPHDSKSVESGSETRVFWRPAPLREDEAQTILRYFVLLTNSKLRDEYGEFWQVAGHTHTVAVEKIWHRLFIQDSKFIIDGTEYSLTDEAKSSVSLSELLSKMLGPLFENRYPSHPVFPETLAMTEVSTLVNDFFSGAKQSGSEIQTLVADFALPLELVTERGESYVHETEENIIKLPIAQQIIGLVNSSSENSVSLKTVSQSLRQPPYGFMREAQCLILSALVAHRQIEFVTSKGDRINRRSLDLNIIWDDIVGIAKPAGTSYGGKRLIDWVVIVTGNPDVKSLVDPGDQAAIKSSFETWLKIWESKRVLIRFEELPDEIFNTQIWRAAVNSQKTFGVVATTVRELLVETITIEEALHRIADAFSDREEVFENCERDFQMLEDFIDTVDRRNEISMYLAVCGATENAKLEEMREELLQVIEEIYFNPDKTLRNEMNTLWGTFHEEFTEHFSVNHDAVMKSHLLQEKYDEIRRSDEWWEFENLSSITAFAPAHWHRVNDICRQFKELNCRFNVKEMLKTHPFCACSFTLSEADDWERLPELLEENLSAGRTVYRNSLRKLRDVLTPLIEGFGKSHNAGDYVEASRELISTLRDEKALDPLNTQQLIMLQNIFQSLPASAFEQIHVLDESDIIKSDDMWDNIELSNI